MMNLIKLFALILFLGIAIFPISAFAAANSGARAFGESAVPISGWVISNLRYQFGDNPSVVTSATFDLDALADQVSVKLNSTTSEFTTCTNARGFSWQCDFPSGVRLSSMDEFRVIAVGN